MELLKKIFSNTLFSINIISLFVLVLSAFSDRVSPNSLIIFPFLGLFFPFILTINLLFLLGWIVLRQWKKCLFIVLVLLICSNAIFTYFPLHTKTKKLPPDCIELLTYNVMRFDFLSPHGKGKVNQVIQYIQNENADIVCIQEYATYEHKGFLSDSELNQALKYPHRHIMDLDNSPKSKYGLAIYSKFPILSAKKIDLGSAANSAFQVELDIRGKKTTLINIHLESNKLSQQDRDEYLLMTKEFNSDKLDIITSVLAKRLAPAYKIRAKQAEIITEIIQKNKNPYLIVCGDFNDTPISYARRTIKGDLKDAFTESGSGFGISYNRNRFLFRIDHIFHNKNIKAYNATVDRKRYSDHYPVRTYLEFR